MGMDFFQKLQKRNRDFTIEIDGHDLPVKVIENERARRLILRLEPKGDGLRLTTPRHVEDRQLQAFVERNRNWARTRLQRTPEKKLIEAGSVLPLRGIDHLVCAIGGLRGSVTINQDDDGNRINVPGELDRVGGKLLSWLKQQARRDLDKAVTHHASQLGVRPKKLRITDTTSRWGSCSSTRTLSFSWRIIMAPPEVLDYLVAHEVAHLKEMNHSPRFWAHVETLCPDMNQHKQWLRKHGAQLHAISF